MVEVSFRVQSLPGSECAIDTLELVLVNDLLPELLHQSALPLTKAPDSSYSGVIQALPNTELKYFYRINQSLTEAGPTHQPILFRTFHPSGFDQVQDVISTWEGCAYNPPTATVRGVITLEGKPAPGVWIQAAGLSAVTHHDGSFTIPKAPAGRYHLSVSDPENLAVPTQHLIDVETGKATPVEMDLLPAKLVDVTFIVTIPETMAYGSPILHILSDQIYFGGYSSYSVQSASFVSLPLPALTHQEKNIYFIHTKLRSDSVFRYRYTLGNSKWSGETNADQTLRERVIQIESDEMTVNDTVISFSDSPNPSPIIFRVKTPDHTPRTDSIFIQLGQPGWSTPVEMTRISDFVWEFQLTSGYDRSSPMHYRFCRNAQCGFADEVDTAGYTSSGLILENASPGQMINHEIRAWQWLPPEKQTARVTVNTTIQLQDHSTYWSGIEWSSCMNPTWEATIEQNITQTIDQKPNWIILRPTFSFGSTTSEAMEHLARQKLMDSFSSAFTKDERTRKTSVALFLTPKNAQMPAEWQNQGDSPAQSWQEWFTDYREAALEMAIDAQEHQFAAIILGGEWVIPFLPPDAEPAQYESFAPPDSDTDWVDLLSELRTHFSGVILFAMPANTQFTDPPLFLSKMDGLYAIINKPEQYQEDLRVNLTQLVDDRLQKLAGVYQIPVVVGIHFPAISRVSPDISTSFEDPCSGEYGSPWLSLTGTYPVDGQAQVNFYSVMLNLINERKWINGFISQGFYPVVETYDYSSSILGKPAAQLIQYWNQSIFSTP